MNRYSLGLTCVARLEIGEGQRSSCCCTMETDSKVRASLGKPLAFYLIYASKELKIRSQYLNPGNYLPFSLIQSSNITFSWYG